MQSYEIQFLTGSLIMVAIITLVLALIAAGAFRAFLILSAGVAAMAIIGVNAWFGEMNFWLALALEALITVGLYKIIGRHPHKA